MVRKIACITLDMERDYSDPSGKIRLLENPEFFQRYVDLIQKYKAKVTMFTVTSLFGEFEDQFKKLDSKIPLEYAVHSHTHNPDNACGQSEVETAFQTFKQYRGDKPLGYRAPIGQINKDGFHYLIDTGYLYDASVYTSYRPGKFGYSNLSKPNVPFRVTNGADSIIEFPFTSISTVRIPFAISYAKLLGWFGYSTLLNTFSLPDVVVALSHPYDFYLHAYSNHGSWLEKQALLRNASRAFDYFEKMILYLQKNGYEFCFMSELYDQTIKQKDLQQFSLESWI